MSDLNRLSLMVEEFRPNEFHYIVLNATRVSAQELSFRLVKVSKQAHKSGNEAWFEGLKVLSRHQKIL